MRHRVRKARPGEATALAVIEDRALEMFKDRPGLESLARPGADPQRYAGLVAAERALVATDARDAPIGFALLFLIDGEPFLGELGVFPEHQRRGIGRSLIEAACDWAREQGRRSLLLRTFRDIPWNAPYYERLGFRTLAPSEIDREGMRAQVSAESDGGMDISRRVFMRKPL